MQKSLDAEHRVCVRDLQRRLWVYIFGVCLHMSASICVTLGLVFATVLEDLPASGALREGGGVSSELALRLWEVMRNNTLHTLFQTAA